MSARMTALGTGIELVNRHHTRPYQAALYCTCLTSSPQPTSAIALCQTVILHHVLDLKRLDTHHLVVADESSRQLVQEITASVGNAGMDASDPLACLLSVLGALLASWHALVGHVPAAFHPSGRSARCPSFPRSKVSPHHAGPDQSQRSWARWAVEQCPLPPERFSMSSPKEKVGKMP